MIHGLAKEKIFCARNGPCFSARQDAVGSSLVNAVPSNETTGGVVQNVASKLALVIVHIHKDLNSALFVPRIFALWEQVLAILIAADNQLRQYALREVHCESVE